MQKLIRASALVALVATSTTFAAPTADDVGDVDSFGRAFKYLGAKSGPQMIFQNDCSEYLPSDPGVRCIVIAAPSATRVPFDAAARLHAPITVTSSVLNTAGIDPAAGAPLAGRIQMTLPLFAEINTLVPNAIQSKSVPLTRSCIGGLISRAGLKDNYGLTAAQAASVFANPITVSIGSVGNANWLNQAWFTLSLRLFED